MSTVELTKKVRELKELKLMAEELAAEIADIEAEIKEEMTARDVEEMEVDVFKVRWTKVKSRRFDLSAFKQSAPELTQVFTKTVETRRFSIV